MGRHRDALVKLVLRAGAIDRGGVWEGGWLSSLAFTVGTMVSVMPSAREGRPGSSESTALAAELRNTPESVVHCHRNSPFEFESAPKARDF